MIVYVHVVDPNINCLQVIDMIVYVHVVDPNIASIPTANCVYT